MGCSLKQNNLLAIFLDNIHIGNAIVIWLTYWWFVTKKLLPTHTHHRKAHNKEDRELWRRIAKYLKANWQSQPNLFKDKRANPSCVDYWLYREASCFISSKPLNPYHQFQMGEKHLCVQSLVPLVLSLHMASSHILLAALKVSLLTTSSDWIRDWRHGPFIFFKNLIVELKSLLLHWFEASVWRHGSWIFFQNLT
jgi:hypothetical protein